MAPQTYELSFALSVTVIFVCIIVFILAINLFVSVLRFVFRKVASLFLKDSKIETREPAVDKVFTPEPKQENKNVSKRKGTDTKKT